MMSFLRLHFRTLLRWGLVSGLAFWLALAAGVNIVAAHADLVESDPSNGALLDESPEKVSARFSQELDGNGSTIAVFDQAGQQVDAGNGRVDLNDLDHKTMVVTVPSSLADGAYVVRWTAVSTEDGDETSGAFSFTVGGAAPVGEASAVDASNGLSPVLLLAAIVIGVLIVAGVVFMGRKRRVREKEKAR